MILAAYLVTAFLVASVYAVGMLRGRRDRHHRLGLLIPLTVGCILAPIQFMVGDTAARAIAEDQPIKFAAMECVEHTHSRRHRVPRRGLHRRRGQGRDRDPRASTRSWSASAPTPRSPASTRSRPNERPPANTMLHWSFDAMVGIGTALIALGAWFGFVWWRRRDIPKTPWFLRAVAISGVAAIVAMECGWIVTEVGRQPWIVQGVMRTEDAVTGASGVWLTFSIVLVLYAAARHRDRAHPPPDGAALARGGGGCGRRALRPEHRDRRRRRSVSKADVCAAILWVGATLYAVFGGADFGAGFWSLVGGSGERGERARRLIDSAIGPVWEANHVWLIFILVVLWTAFSVAFEAVMSTLVHPALPGGAGDRPARLGLRLPRGRQAAGRAQLRRASVRGLLGDHPVLHGHRGRRDRLRPGPARQRDGRPVVELAEPGLDPGRRPFRRHRRLPGGRLPDHRRPPRRRRGPRALLRRPARWSRRWSPARSRSPGSSSSATTPATSTTASPPKPCRW